MKNFENFKFLQHLMLQREGISDCNLRNTKLRAIAEQVDTIQEDATSALVSIEDVETLVLEVYNSMQSDGEHIFLPQSIASQLHAVAQMLVRTSIDLSICNVTHSWVSTPSCSRNTSKMGTRRTTRCMRLQQFRIR